MKISLPKAMNKLTPSFFCHFRARFLQRSPLLVAPIRHISTAIVLGLMIPVSFSLYPQLGTVGLTLILYLLCAFQNPNILQLNILFSLLYRSKRKSWKKN